MSALAIACPGQGTQHPEMFDLALQSEAAAQWLADYSDALEMDLVKLARNGDQLFTNRHAQYLICGVAGAMWAAVRQQLPAPDVFVGYSVGELAAYGCADVWNARELAAVVRQRAALMSELAPPSSGMIAVKGLSVSASATFFLQHKLDIAIINGDDHVVLGGSRTDLDMAAGELAAAGHWCKVLDVSIPSHTPVMARAAKAFRTVLMNTPMHPFSAPVLAGIDACPTTLANVADTLSAQIAQSVRWQDCMKGALERGVTVVLELGPGKSLSRMFDELDAKVDSRSAEDFRTLDGIVRWVLARLE